MSFFVVFKGMTEGRRTVLIFGVVKNRIQGRRQHALETETPAKTFSTLFKVADLAVLWGKTTTHTQRQDVHRKRHNNTTKVERSALC